MLGLFFLAVNVLELSIMAANERYDRTGSPADSLLGRRWRVVCVCVCVSGPQGSVEQNSVLLGNSLTGSLERWIDLLQG